MSDFRIEKLNFGTRGDPESQALTTIGRKFIAQCDYDLAWLIVDGHRIIEKAREMLDYVGSNEDNNEELQEMRHQKQVIHGLNLYIHRYKKLSPEVPIDSLLPLMYSVIYMAGTGISSTPYGVRMPSVRLSADIHLSKIAEYCFAIFGSDPWVWFDEIKENLRRRRVLKIIEDSRERSGRISLNKLDLMHEVLSEPFNGVYQEVRGNLKKTAYLILGKEIAPQFLKLGIYIPS